jgi:hypothetical protein
MSTSKTWPSTGSTNVTPTAYSIPQAGDVNWASLTDFLVALANGAQATTFQRFALRVATTTPVTVSTNDCAVQIKLAVPGAVAVTLPAGVNKQYFIISDGTGDASTNNITITPNAGETINGQTTLVLSLNGSSVLLAFQSSDNDWKILSQSSSSFAPASIALPNDQILIGNSSNVAQARTMSGDITIDNTGVTAISTGVIVDADINASAAIAASKLAALTASRAVVTDSSGFISTTTTTSTEIGYVNGVTSSIQTQLNAKTANPLTTTGDIIYASNTASPATPARLGIGSTNTVLLVNGGLPSWGQIVDASISSSAAITLSKLAGLTISRALVSDGSGVISAATTTSTQIGYLSSATGTTGTTSTNLVFSTSPTLVTPILGAATATTINKVTITTPATGSTLTIADGKTLTVNNTLTFSGTDTNSFTFPSGSSTVMTLASTDTITGAKTFNDGKLILAGSSSGTSTLKAQATAGSTTFTLPTTTGTLIGSGDTGTVTSTMILDGTIVNADINASAAIAYSKLNLSNSIVNADINSSAAIDGSKINPSFGNQAVVSTLSVEAGALIAGNNDGTGSGGPGTIRGATKTGTNINGNELSIQAGNGTGSGGSGIIGFYTAPAAGSSSTPNTMTLVGTWTNTGVLNLIFGQVQFPASQNASSGANVLDDYEEGTWTPTITSSGGGTPTYNTQQGSYVKIGKVVTARAYVSFNKTGLTAGNLSLSLPFTSENVSNTFGPVTVTYWTGWTTTMFMLGGLISPNGSTVALYKTSGATTTGVVTLTVADASTNCDFAIQMTYNAPT